MLTRMQSATYTSVYKTANGSIKPTLFRGLYQGFGPTLLAGVPGSTAFFGTYEASKAGLERARTAGYLPAALPQSFDHVVSSACAELVAAAIANPAEVLKQNAQVAKGAGRDVSVRILKQFYRRPSTLWAGYTALVASHLPGTCLTFGLYESLKEELLRRAVWKMDEDMIRQTKVSAISAAAAGGLSSLFFVPIDVVRTRMRLSVGEQDGTIRQFAMNVRLGPAGLLSSSVPPRHGTLAVAQSIFRKEGITVLFRGSGLTCLTAAIGNGLYLGCYEGGKLYFGGSRLD
ncbi:mitochondrial carrier protein [Penicillium chermesinum]|nr:mitochondrial carrier protein [Penicillium chermesinum]